MTTVSYPAVGDEGYSADQWQAQFGSFDGIIDDQGGAFSVTVNDGANTLTVAPGKVQVAGYVLEVTVAEVLTVSTAAATYWVVAKYDPALNVADGGGDADPLGPCRLQLVSGTPSTSGGKAYVTICKFTRVTSQLLSDAFAGREDRRFRNSPQWQGFELQSNTRGYLETRPIGARFHEQSTGNDYVYERIPGDTDPSWRNVSRPVSQALPCPASLVAQDAAPTFLTYPDGHIQGKGTLKRSSGSPLNNGSDVKLATFAVGARPAGYRRVVFFATYADGTRGSVWGFIESTGDLWLYEASVPYATPWASGTAATVKKQIAFIALDAMTFYTEQ